MREKEFIEKATEKHGNKYSYENLCFKPNQTKHSMDSYYLKKSHKKCDVMDHLFT